MCSQAVLATHLRLRAAPSVAGPIPHLRMTALVAVGGTRLTLAAQLVAPSLKGGLLSLCLRVGPNWPKLCPLARHGLP
jgi:hypothetical protein